MIESPTQQPIQNVPRAYPYDQYSDDPNVSAFFTAYTQIAQGYLQWYNQNCLGLYTGQSGPLLDWIGANLYNLPRPIIGTFTLRQWGSWGTAAFGQMPYGMQQLQESGTAQTVDDDIYQRFLTMWLYLGDGKQMSVEWIRRRVARFLYGAGGADISVEDLQNVSIEQPVLPPIGVFGTVAYGTTAYGTLSVSQSLAAHTYAITITPSAAAHSLQSLFQAGLLPLPFQIKLKFLVEYSYMTDGSGNPFVLGSSTLG